MFFWAHWNYNTISFYYQLSNYVFIIILRYLAKLNLAAFSWFKAKKADFLLFKKWAFLLWNWGLVRTVWRDSVNGKNIVTLAGNCAPVFSACAYVQRSLYPDGWRFGGISITKTYPSRTRFALLWDGPKYVCEASSIIGLDVAVFFLFWAVKNTWKPWLFDRQNQQLLSFPLMRMFTEPW